MEQLFVRILNVTLLGAGFIALLSTIGAVVFLFVTGYPILFAETKDRPLNVQYQSLSTVSGSTTSEPKPESSAVDPDLMRAADLACKSANQMVAFLSNSALEISVSDCALRYVNAEVSDQAREINHLEQLSAYFDAARLDPQIQTKYPKTTDKNTMDRYITQIKSEFSSEFDKAAAVDDERVRRQTNLDS